ncbi:MAG: glycosyltransferase family 1 protein [Microbacteriaceae bacterium]|nr:glycosyltransferase family 1 protein [Microbacteriaceae bacterium]
MKKKLLILSFSNINSDARVLKQINLFADDYEVTTCSYGKKPERAYAHYEIPAESQYWNYSRVQLILKLYKFAYFGNAAVAEVLRLIGGQKFDVIIANDIETLGVALELNPINGVLVDLHEYAPYMNEESWRWSLFVSPFISWMCRVFLPKANTVTTVGPLIANEYKQKFSIDTLVVTNATDYHDLKPKTIQAPIRMVHSGVALRNRGIDAVISAVESANASVTLDLYLMPNDSNYLNELKKHTENSERVFVREPVAYQDLVKVLNGYDLGIHFIPPVNKSYEYTLPNKFFDSIQARLGMIIGPSLEMAELVNKYGLGLVANGFGIDDIRSSIEKLSVADVALWKANADKAASELSSSAQTAVWRDAVTEMLTKFAG